MSKHDKTLAAIFAKPTRANLKWRDIESLLKSLGAVIQEGRGSRIRILCRDRAADFHRPHPSPDASKGAIDAVRDFLEQIGLKP